MDGRKRGFTNQNYGGTQANGQSGQSTYQYNGNEQAAFNDAAAYINARRFQDALNVLEQLRTRNAMWFYYSAVAMNGIGNNITALEYAQTGQYRTGQQTYGSPYAGMANCCYSILMFQLCSACCCR